MLTSETLTWFKDEQEKEVKYQLPLEGCRIVEPDDTGMFKRKFTFCIMNPSKAVILKDHKSLDLTAVSQDEKESWLGAFLRAGVYPMNQEAENVCCARLSARCLMLCCRRTASSRPSTPFWRSRLRPSGTSSTRTLPLVRHRCCRVQRVIPYSEQDDAGHDPEAHHAHHGQQPQIVHQGGSAGQHLPRVGQGWRRVWMRWASHGCGRTT